MLCGEALRTFSHKVDMRAVAQNLASGADGIAKPLDAADASGAQGRAIHDEGVELHLAVAIEETAATCVESLVVFHDDHGFFDRIERRAATFEHAPARSHGIAHAVEVGVDHVVRNGPCAAVNHQNRIGQEKSLLRK